MPGKVDWISEAPADQRINSERFPLNLGPTVLPSSALGTAAQAKVGVTSRL